MTEAFKWIALLAVVWAIRELMVSLWTWRRTKKYDRILRVEQTRSDFARARNELMRLAVQERIDPNSVTFQTLYQIHTVFMRSPDRHRELSAAVQRGLLGDNQKPDPQFLAESHHWSDEVRQTVKTTADAMKRVVIEYSVLFWIASLIVEKPWLAKNILRVLRAIIERLERFVEERNPDIGEIRKAQLTMEHMAVAA